MGTANKYKQSTIAREIPDKKTVSRMDLGKRLKCGTPINDDHSWKIILDGTKDPTKRTSSSVFPLERGIVDETGGSSQRFGKKNPVDLEQGCVIGKCRGPYTKRNST